MSRRTTEDFRDGMMVKLPEGEQGQVSEIDHDSNLVWVKVPLANGGFDLVDLDPADLTPLETL